MIALTQEKREELIALIEKSLPVMNAQVVMRNDEFKKHIEIYEIALSVLVGNGTGNLNGGE